MANVIQVILRAKDEISGEFDKVSKKMGSVNKNLMMVGAAAGAMSAAVLLPIKKTMSEMSQFGDYMAKTSARTGIATDTLVQLSFVAERVGTNFDRLTNGLKRLAGHVYDANRGLATSEELFEDLGISIYQADGSMKSMEELLFDVSDAMAKMDDPTKKLGIAVKLFGRSGQELIPILSQGREGFKSLMKEAKALGFTMSTEQGKMWEEYVDRMTDVQAAMKGVKMQIAADLAPTITNLMERVSKAIAGFSAWIREHPKLTKAVLWLAIAIGGGAGLIAALSMIVAISGPVAAAWALMTGPIGLLVMGIVGVTFVVIKFRKQIGEAMLKAADVVLLAVQKMLEGLGWILKKLGVNWLDGAIEGIEKARGKLAEWNEGLKDTAKVAKKAADEMDPKLSGAMGEVGDSAERSRKLLEDVEKQLKEIAESDYADRVKEIAEKIAHAGEGVEIRSPWGEEEGPKPRMEIGLGGLEQLEVPEIAPPPLEPWEVFAVELGDMMKDVGLTVDNVADGISGAFADSMMSAIVAGEDFAKSFSRAVGEMVKSVLRELTKIIVKMLVIKALKSVLGLPFEEGGEVPTVPGFQAGGLVTGPLGNDRVLARLTAGEMVLPKSLVDFMRRELKGSSGVVKEGVIQEVHRHYHISAIDSESIREALRSGDLGREMEYWTEVR